MITHTLNYFLFTLPLNNTARAPHKITGEKIFDDRVRN